MEERIKSSHINKKVKTIRIKEYDYRDVINKDNSLGNRKTPYIEVVLRPRLKHITFSSNTHPKSQIIYGMAVKIFFAVIKVIIEELFKGNSIEFQNVGVFRLKTKKSKWYYNSTYTADKNRSKNLGFYTEIECMFNTKEFKYKKPFISFGSFYKKKIQEMENQNIKF